MVGAGPVTTWCSGPASDANYIYTYLEGVLSVARDMVTVQASNASMTFGDPVPVIGFTFGHAVAGAPVSPPTCSAPTPSRVGVQATSCQGVTMDANYTYDYWPGVLTVLPRPVTVTATGGSITLGDPVPDDRVHHRWPRGRRHPDHRADVLGRGRLRRR